MIAPLAPAIGPPHSHRADEIAAAPPEPLARSGLLAIHAVFLGLSALFCSRVFLLTDLNSHAILAGDPGRWCADAGRPTRFKPSSPSPPDAVRDGSAKLGHPVQNVTREHGLTPLPR